MDDDSEFSWASAGDDAIEPSTKVPGWSFAVSAGYLCIWPIHCLHIRNKKLLKSHQWWCLKNPFQYTCGRDFRRRAWTAFRGVLEPLKAMDIPVNTGIRTLCLEFNQGCDLPLARPQFCKLQWTQCINAVWQVILRACPTMKLQYGLTAVYSCFLLCSSMQVLSWSETLQTSNFAYWLGFTKNVFTISKIVESLL